MNIYRLFHKADGFKSINIKGTPLESILIESRNDANFDIISGDKFSWGNDSNEKTCDFPFIDGSIPVFSEKATTAIQNILSKEVIQTLIYVDNSPYYILDSPILNSVLDKENSNIKCFKDGRIMHIKKYAFKANKVYPDMFRIQECSTFTFVTESILKALINAGITTGLDYELCILE